MEKGKEIKYLDEGRVELKERSILRNIDREVTDESEKRIKSTRHRSHWRLSRHLRAYVERLEVWDETRSWRENTAAVNNEQREESVLQKKGKWGRSQGLWGEFQKNPSNTVPRIERKRAGEQAQRRRQSMAETK